VVTAVRPAEESTQESTEPPRDRTSAGPEFARTTATLVRDALDDALARAEARGDGVTVLDAGCGRVSALLAFRPRIDRFVGADIHSPAPGSLPHLDEFRAIDLCTEPDAFPASSFDVALSSFTMEHFADPAAAVANIRGWLRPGGRLVLVTVNRRHPFVAAYLGLPSVVRARLQPLVKATAADAHPLVGACNTPAEIRDALAGAGFVGVRVETVGHLEAAWARRSWTRALGAIGDRLTAGTPSRRSTIVAWAEVPATPGPDGAGR
jgi:SAM-dependent methyltransferase